MSDAERYPGENVGLLAHLPAFAQRVLVAGVDAVLLCALLKRTRQAVAWAWLPPGISASATASLIDGVVANEDAADSQTTNHPQAVLAGEPRFDAVIITDSTPWQADIPAFITLAASALTRNGWLFLRLTEGSGPFPASALHEAGLSEYARWDANGDALLCCVPDEYNPVDHARALFDAGDPAAANDVLERIPAVYLDATEVRLSVQLDRQLCLLAMLKERVPGHDPLSLFHRIQRIGDKVTANRPLLHAPYQCNAENWRAIGNPHMARRILRSILHVAHDNAAEEQCRHYPETAPAPTPEHAPQWRQSAGEKTPRVLFLIHPRMHYGIDVLYDGLCRVVGPEHVIDFPAKPSLHGRPEPTFANYPCVFQRPEHDCDYPHILADLKAGRFDLVLYGDCECELPEDMVRPLLEAAGQTPVFVVDALDEPMDMRAAVCAHTGLSLVSAYFKREMLACWDYGPGAYPLPFGYPDALVGPPPEELRPDRLFWAGHRCSGLRRLYIDHIEARYDMRFVESYPQEVYSRRLHESRVGLNCFGFGFDTVRYWELPAHGCMLLSERMPIRIPDNFKDGEQAVFFEDLPDLERKLDYFLEDPDVCLRIARAGHEHLRKHHTGSARARQLLARL
ncbi:MAG: glycosyltransferase [Candidatus Hydrogenedentota bacterium]